MREMPRSNLKYVVVFCFVFNVCVHLKFIAIANQDDEFLANEVAIQPMLQSHHIC